MGVIKKRGITYAGGGGGEEANHSLVEHKTGQTWIDGSDIWEVTLNIPNFTAGTSESRIGSYEGVVNLANYGLTGATKIFPIIDKTYITLQDNTTRIPIYIDWQTGTTISILFPFAARTGTLTLTLQYIKSS